MRYSTRGMPTPASNCSRQVSIAGLQARAQHRDEASRRRRRRSSRGRSCRAPPDRRDGSRRPGRNSSRRWLREVETSARRRRLLVSAGIRGGHFLQARPSALETPHRPRVSMQPAQRRAEAQLQRRRADTFPVVDGVARRRPVLAGQCQPRQALDQCQALGRRHVVPSLPQQRLGDRGLGTGAGPAACRRRSPRGRFPIRAPCGEGIVRALQHRRDARRLAGPKRRHLEAALVQTVVADVGPRVLQQRGAPGSRPSARAAPRHLRKSGRAGTARRSAPRGSRTRRPRSRLRASTLFATSMRKFARMNAHTASASDFSCVTTRAPQRSVMSTSGVLVFLRILGFSCARSCRRSS